MLSRALSVPVPLAYLSPTTPSAFDPLYIVAHNVGLHYMRSSSTSVCRLVLAWERAYPKR